MGAGGKMEASKVKVDINILSIVLAKQYAGV
jgi:hypothetical protein